MNIVFPFEICVVKDAIQMNLNIFFKYTMKSSRSIQTPDLVNYPRTH